jgi:hypothetical protein
MLREKSRHRNHRLINNRVSGPSIAEDFIIMRKNFVAALIAGAAVVAAIGLSSTPAFAAPTFTVSPGGAATASTTSVTLKDGSVSLTCSKSTGSATLKSGSGLSGIGIGSISALAFSGCTGPLGAVTVTVNSLPYSLNLLSYTAPTSFGYVGGVNVKVSMTGCSFTVTGSAPGNYNNTAKTLNFTATGTGVSPALVVSGVSGCLGLVKNGDVPTYVASYAVTPAQTITSP